jgi:hypothetical protein
MIHIQTAHTQTHAETPTDTQRHIYKAHITDICIDTHIHTNIHRHQYKHKHTHTHTHTHRHSVTQDGNRW